MTRLSSMIPNKELTTYIQHRRTEGASDNTVVTELRDAGWANEDIQHGLSSHVQNNFFSFSLSRLLYGTVLVIVGGVIGAVLTLVLLRKSSTQIPPQPQATEQLSQDSSNKAAEKPTETPLPQYKNDVPAVVLTLSRCGRTIPPWTTLKEGEDYHFDEYWMDLIVRTHPDLPWEPENFGRGSVGNVCQFTDGTYAVAATSMFQFSEGEELFGRAESKIFHYDINGRLLHESEKLECPGMGDISVPEIQRVERGVLIADCWAGDAGNIAYATFAVDLTTFETRDISNDPSTLCKGEFGKPGLVLFPAASKYYKGMSWDLAQIFTADDCGKIRLQEVISKLSQQTLRFGLTLRNPPNPQLSSTMKQLKLVCALDPPVPPQCMDWDTSGDIPMIDILKLKPHLDQIESMGERDY